MHPESNNNVDSTIVNLTPRLDSLTPDYIKFCERMSSQILKVEPTKQIIILERFRNELIPNDLVSEEELALLFAKSVTLDLVAQGWKLYVTELEVRGSPPNVENETKATAKQIIRNSHLLGRDTQLREKSVRDFILGMERRRLTSKGWHSIYSLMRDGEVLAGKLKQIDQLTNESEKLEELSKTISPYLQFIDPDAICSQTGLRLGDIWRYFRHTWVNEYKSIPGRSMTILIRDAAAPNHPVIGIAALGSSVVQHLIRDKWIGWQSETIVNEIAENPTPKLAVWLLDSLRRLISDIYLKDLEEEGLLSASDLENPTGEIIEQLMLNSEIAMAEHRKEPQRTKHNGQKNENIKDDFWKRESRTFLYRGKRCKQLSKLLNIRRVFQEDGFIEGAKFDLHKIFSKTTIRNSIAQLVRMIKAEHVGVDMMDITVCGAIAPYNSLLGGKLVCMLLCSPEVTQHHARRYAEQVSIIASAMKGEPVTRKPNLVLLCTTSLYGVGSSQYNRVKIPLNEIGIDSKESVVYKELGHSFGYGTYHFSRTTIQLGSNLNSRKKGGRRVNSIFGEGVNPLMRKIRESLEQVGLDSTKLLQHGNQRVTYGIQLAKNFREILLGIHQHPHYLLPHTNSKSQSKKISDYWRRRWLSPRIKKMEILDEVAKHTLIFPMRHGATVPLIADIEDKAFFFEA